MATLTAFTVIDFDTFISLGETLDADDYPILTSSQIRVLYAFSEPDTYTDFFGTGLVVDPVTFLPIGGAMTQGELLVLAANTGVNATNIDLVGLQQSGVEFV